LSKLPFTPKRRRFAQNGVVLGILGFTFFFFFFEKKKEIKKKKKKKKKGRNRGGWSHPLPKIWGGRTTPFLAKGWSATPYRPYGGGRSHPRPLGVVRPPRKAKKKKKNKKTKKWVWDFGGGRTTPKGLGVAFGHPLRPVGGVRSHPQALGGGPATPKGQNPFFPFFFWPFGVAGPPPKAWGGFGHPHTAGMGWPKPPLGQKWGGPATPISFFFFLFFFFNFLLFFKKKNPKICKTTPFWTSPKRRSFGVEDIMGIYIYLYTHYTLEGS
jgi:hypothetical protein